MPALPTRPFLVIYIGWHPDFAAGPEIADALYQHYRRDLYENIAGGAGLSVVFRSVPPPDATVPISVDFEEAETSAVVFLVDERLAADAAWTAYGRDLIARAEETGLRARVFPVAINRAALQAGLDVQAIRWDTWVDDEPEDRRRKLIAELTYQFCRMLRHYLEHLKRPMEPEEALEHYLEKVRIFLSHSKHDHHGTRIALAIRNKIHHETGLASFFDVRDIPAGLHFSKVLIQYVRVSAVVAIHTDSYSSREWCRREIIEAKRWNVPLVVANCITDLEERGFPYLGNVPVVRIEPDAEHRISYVIGRLLDEVLKDFLWRCRIELPRAQGAVANVVFLPRPPELISLTGLPTTGAQRFAVTLVYPDPPIGAEEAGLFDAVAPTVSLRSYTEWLGEQMG